MRTRAWALRIVLGLLAFIAIGAFVGALSGSWDTIGRVIGTGAIGAVVGLLTIPLTGFADRPRLRVGAMGALAYLGVETVLFILGIWLVDRGTVDYGERMLIAGGVFAVTLLPTVAALFVLPLLQPRWLPVLSMILSGVATLLTLPMVSRGLWNASSAPLAEECAVFGMALAVGTLLIVGAVMRRESESAVPGLSISVLPTATLAVIALLIFDPPDYGPQFGYSWRVIGTLAVIGWSSSVVLVVWYASRLIDLRGAQRHLRTAFAISGLAGSAMIGTSSWQESELAAALGAACLVVAACVLVAIAIFVRLNRRVEMATQIEEIVPGSMECPRCTRAMELRPGQGTCAACGLGYRLEIEPPRCRRCRHDVTHARSTNCPECGEPILLPTATAVVGGGDGASGGSGASGASGGSGASDRGGGRGSGGGAVVTTPS